MRQYLMLLFIMLLPQLSLSLQIPCQAQLEQGVQYRKIFWYKVTESNSVVGLIMKDLCKNTTALYKHANHSYQIGDDLSLLLLSEPGEKRETKCETYRCSVWPPVGYYIQESDYSLPQGCQNTTEMMPEFACHAVDMKMTSVSHIHILIPVGVLFLVLLCCFALLYKQREKKTKFPCEQHTYLNSGSSRLELRAQMI